MRFTGGTMRTHLAAFLLGVALTAVIAWRLTVRFHRLYHRKQRKLLERTLRAQRRAELDPRTGGLPRRLKPPLSPTPTPLTLRHQAIPQPPTST